MKIGKVFNMSVYKQSLINKIMKHLTRKSSKKYADELFNKFRVGPGTPHLWEITDKKISKHFALVCIDEMMEVIPKNTNSLTYMTILSKLQQAKQEIEKL